MDQLQPWIERELRIVLGPDEELTLLMNVIRSLLDTHSLQHEQAKIGAELQDFLFDHTTRFVQELYLFSTTVWNLETYDEQVEYRCTHD